MLKGISGDRLFFLIVVILVVGGMAMFVSASLGLLARADESPLKLAFTQLILGLIPGVIALVTIRYTPLSFIQKLAPAIYLASIAATALVFTPLGPTLNGARRWIDIGFTTVQPAELLKIGVVLMLAWYLAKMKGKLQSFTSGLIPFGLIVGIPVVLLLLQPNTSTVLVLGATSIALYILAGGPWRDVLLMVVGALLVLAILVGQRPYLMNRVMTFMNPAENSLTTGYQIQQSLIAIGSGGFMGRGFGQSAQKFNYLPEAQGDSVFAVFSEEFGFIGSVFMVLLFVGFAMRGFSIAADASTLFGSLAATGLTLLISLSAFLNIGAMLAILPLTGLPLPFVSHGGTALLFALASVGIILNVAAHRKGKTASK
jgi:cell division protein FtsW